MALLEDKFQKGPGVDGLFPTKTPVEFGKGDEAAPKLSAGIASKFFDRFSKRLKPLMKVRDAMDSVYSKGYFENHYPKLDKQLKEVLHDEVKVAKSRLLATDEEPCDEEENEGITININIGGLLGK